MAETNSHELERRREELAESLPALSGSETKRTD